MRTLLLSLMLLGAFTIQAEDIQLAKPDTNKGADVMQTFAQRRSTREFNTKRIIIAGHVELAVGHYGQE